jgi:hypothetical protein
MRRLTAIASLCCAFIAAPAFAESPRREVVDHPRITRAIHELEDAMAYLEAAPHDFGGHKAAALEASHKAVEELKLALVYRSGADTAKGK